MRKKVVALLVFMLVGPVPAGPVFAQRSESEPATEAAQDADAGQGAESHQDSESQQDSDKEKSEELRLTINERIMVIGHADTVRDIPGSAHYLTRSDLERNQQLFGDVQRYLRQVPGVNVQEEEGFGLRPNIGLRGSGVERSSKITLMEDGVLISPAPYAAPGAYYFPTAARMDAIEVRKGSSQVKYGPRTNGGAMNLISTPIPYAFSLRADAGGGQHGTGRAHVSAGSSTRRFGWMLETYQISTAGFKRLDGGGGTGFELHDYLGKVRVNSDRRAAVYQELEMKFGLTEQISDETYLGLTDADFAVDPLRRYAGSQEDVFRSDHRQLQARYFIAPSQRLDLTAIAYRNGFSRNWYKLQSVLGTAIGDIFDDTERYAGELAIVKGADSAADALRVRANNRDYTSQGFQAVVGLRADAAAAHNQLELGFRYHEDQEDRFQNEDGYQMLGGDMLLTGRGAPGSQSNRVSDARAWAFFAQDRIGWGNWSVTPGLRYESIDLVRTDYSKSDPDRTAPTRIRENHIEVWIPGVGVGYDVSSLVHVFGGIHKGFSPPGPGSNELTAAEESVNYELGMRAHRGSLLTEFVGFYNDYSNLLGADTLSSGSTGSGDLFNGGEVRVVGFEAAAQVDLAEASSGISFPLRASYTFTDAQFRNSFVSRYEPWGSVEVGDELPYLPRHQFHSTFGVDRDRWRAELESTYMGRMRTEAGQGEVPTGRATEAHLVFNISGEYRVASRAHIYLGVQNLTDNAYIVARRPAGVRPGLPRTLVAGIKFDLE